MDSYIKANRRLMRKMAIEDFWNKLLRPLRVSRQFVLMNWAIWRRREFAQSFDLDHLIMNSGSKESCERYVAWVQIFRNRAHHRSL